MFICKERRSPVRRLSISMREWNSLQNVDQQRFFSCELACKFETEATTVADMRKSITIPSLVCALLSTVNLPIASGTSDQEKAFTAKYNKAFEAKDAATLKSSLTTKAS